MQQDVPAPRTPRELFELFAIYDQRRGINSMLDAIDFAEVDRACVLTAVLGAVARRRLEQPMPADYSARVHFRNLLQSLEFRERARPLIAASFAEKRRAIFIHIPKCAGTDMTETLRARYPVLLQGHFDPRGHAPEALFQHLHEFALAARDADTIALGGHERLAYYQQNEMVRPGDWVFTIVREPAALIYSHISYVLTVCRAAPVTRRPDGLAWLAALGIDEIPEDASAGDMAEFGRMVLYHAGIPLINPMCRSLGDDSAASALARIVEGNVEITDAGRYAAWRRARFPGAGETRANASVPYFNAGVATARDRDRIASMTEEDHRLFALIAERLDRGNGLSIWGSALG